MKYLQSIGLLLLLFYSTAAPAHTDLHVQIDHLTRELANDPDNTEILIKRGDLHRRHQSWQQARDDFTRVREIQPEHAYIDWFEGRLEVEAGNPESGVTLLTRFLNANPNHPVALQNRAKGYRQLDKPLLVAQDYHAVIEHARKPGPEIYGECAMAYMAAGTEHYHKALQVTRAGLEKMPGEISLTGMAADIALAMGDLQTAQAVINGIPGPLLGLAQWQARSALLDCQAGREKQAAEGFTNALGTAQRTGRTALPISPEWLQQLALDPSPGLCHEALMKSGSWVR